MPFVAINKDLTDLIFKYINCEPYVFKIFLRHCKFDMFSGCLGIANILLDLSFR